MGGWGVEGGSSDASLIKKKCTPSSSSSSRAGAGADGVEIRRRAGSRVTARRSLFIYLFISAVIYLFPALPHQLPQANTVRLSLRARVSPEEIYDAELQIQRRGPSRVRVWHKAGHLHVAVWLE